MQLVAAVPGIFTANASGSGQGAILNQNFSANSLSNPAAKGSVVQIFGTGDGQTTPPGVTGSVSGSTLRTPQQQPVTATVGGQAATVQYAGSAPGLIAGVFQVSPRMEKASRLIFDMRGYPRLRAGFLGHFMRTPVHGAKGYMPIITAPDHRDIVFKYIDEAPMPPAAPFLSARKVFLIDGRVISYAETCMAIIANGRLGELVGSPTAGTNGNVNAFSLPGGYRVTWTGMKVLKPDGSHHHGIGIYPTIPVSRTIAGVAAGVDELLQRGLEVVNRDGVGRSRGHRQSAELARASGFPPSVCGPRFGLWPARGWMAR